MEDSQTLLPADPAGKTATPQQTESQVTPSRVTWREAFSQKWNQAKERIRGVGGGKEDTLRKTPPDSVESQGTDVPFAVERQDPLAAHIEEREREKKESVISTSSTGMTPTDITERGKGVKKYHQPGVPTPFANLPGTREIISKPPFNPNEKVVYKVVTFNPRQPAHVLDPEGAVDLETLKDQERAKGPKTTVWVREVMPRGY